MKYGVTKEMAERWATNTLKSILDSDLKKKMEREFLDFVVYGKSTHVIKQDGAEDLFRVSNLNSEQIIERFKNGH